MSDEIQVGPQIGDSADNFFQSDSDLVTQERRNAKRGNKAGDPIECTSKVLCLLLSEDSEYAYIGESGFIAKRINLLVNYLSLSLLSFVNTNPLFVRLEKPLKFLRDILGQLPVSVYGIRMEKNIL